MAYHGKINRDILYTIYKELNHGCSDAVHIHTKRIFSSNQIIHKISFSLCFWAPDPLMSKFY